MRGLLLSNQRSIYKAVNGVLERAGCEAELAAIQCPTIVIRGTEDAAIVRPTNQLRGFKRVHLAAGEKQTVTFPLRGEQLTYWNEAKQTFALEAGSVDIKVGASSADIRVSGSLMTQP